MLCLNCITSVYAFPLGNHINQFLVLLYKKKNVELFICDLFRVHLFSTSLRT